MAFPLSLGNNVIKLLITTAPPIWRKIWELKIDFTLDWHGDLINILLSYSMIDTKMSEIELNKF